jgi:hypothetical protein
VLRATDGCFRQLGPAAQAMGVTRGRQVAELRHGAAFLGGLRPFLRAAPDVPEYARRLTQELADRERTLVSMLERCVFGNPASPYRALFGWAGIDAADVAAELESHGLDATLARLHDAGVRVMLDEFKGLRPIERRAAAVGLARAFEGRSAVAQQRLLDLLAACERLDRLPTRFLTGCYVAAVAVRR